MKKMLLATALALLIAGCAQQTFTVQNKPAAVAPKGKPSPIISSFLELGRRKLSMSYLWRQKMLQNRNPAKHSAMIVRFITLSIYTPLEARVYCSQFDWLSLPIDMGNSICTAH